jgi:hypothetical protein
LAAWRGGVHVRLGYGSFREYIERLFGYGARLVQDKLRVAEALEGLPVLGRALQSGQACWSVLRELTRVATRETEGEWLEAAAGRTVRDVEQLVSGHVPGSRPGDPPDEAARRHVLRFEVSGEALASVREALAKIRRDAGESLDDDAALLLMARAVLEGPLDDGRSPYQIALTVCEHCQLPWESTEPPHYRARFRPSRPPCVAWCCDGIMGGVSFPGVATRSMSTSIISRHAPKVVSTIRTTSSPYVERTTELPIAGRSSSKAGSVAA